MSAIGPGSLGAINMAGSLAGSQRNTGEADGLKQRSSERSFQIERKAAAAHSLEDVGETDSTPDRDADGRQPFANADDETTETETAISTATSQSPPGKHRSTDALEERGNVLDLDA